MWDAADWVEPYDAAEAATVPLTHARLPWPLRMAINAAKQWLVLVLWLWASPAMLVISSLRGAAGLRVPAFAAAFAAAAAARPPFSCQ